MRSIAASHWLCALRASSVAASSAFCREASLRDSPSLILPSRVRSAVQRAR